MNRVLPIIKCDQLSSSNGSTPAMTKLARKRLMTFCVSASWSASESPCLWKGTWKTHDSLPCCEHHIMYYKCTGVCAAWYSSLVHFEQDIMCANLLLISLWMSATLARLIMRYWASFTRERDVEVAARRERTSCYPGDCDDLFNLRKTFWCERSVFS